jgi:hypothetical protein
MDGPEKNINHKGAGSTKKKQKKNPPCFSISFAVILTP